jgi:hypothetical protein
MSYLGFAVIFLAPLTVMLLVALWTGLRTPEAPHEAHVAEGTPELPTSADGERVTQSSSQRRDRGGSL